MNSQAFLCTIVYLSVLATEAHSQEGGSCDVLFQTQPLSNLTCNPYIGSANGLALQCNIMVSINASYSVKWYHSPRNFSGEGDLPAVSSTKYHIYSRDLEDEFEGRNVTLAKSILIISQLSASDAGEYWCVVSVNGPGNSEFSPCTKTTLLTPEKYDGLSLCPFTSLYDPTPMCANPQATCSRTPAVDIPTDDTPLNGTGTPNMTSCDEADSGSSGVPVWIYFLLTATCIAFLIIIAVVATYLTAKKTRSLRNEREGPKSNPTVTVQNTAAVNMMPDLSLPYPPLPAALCTDKNDFTKDRDPQLSTTSPVGSVKSSASSEGVAATKSHRSIVPHQKKSLPQDPHISVSPVGSGRHARVAGSCPTVSCPVSAQKHSQETKPAIPRKKRLPDIISNSIATTGSKEERYSPGKQIRPRIGPPLPRLRMSTHPCHDQETVPKTTDTESHSEQRRHKSTVAPARRKPPPIPQMQKRPNPVARDDPDYVNTAYLTGPPGKHFQPPTVVRDGQEYHILSQTPPQNGEGNEVNEMYTAVVNKYQISTIEEFPSELEASMHCYENEEVIPVRYQPLTKQTLESSAEYCSTDFDYLGYQTPQLPRLHHPHWR